MCAENIYYSVYRSERLKKYSKKTIYKYIHILKFK